MWYEEEDYEQFQLDRGTAYVITPQPLEEVKQHPMGFIWETDKVIVTE
jgi:hypothetical protein